MSWISQQGPGPAGGGRGHEAQVPSPAVQATMAEMGERLQTVIEAAERAAESIRADAERQASGHLSEAQRKADRMTAERVRLISELTDDLIRHAAVVREHSERMLNALEQAIGSVTQALADPSLAGPPAPTEPAAVPAITPTPSPPPPEPPPPAAPVDEEALVHATRLAVAGTEPESIARLLRDVLGVEDPGPIVDRVLGSAPTAEAQNPPGKPGPGGGQPSSTLRDASR